MDDSVDCGFRQRRKDEGNPLLMQSSIGLLLIGELFICPFREVIFHVQFPTMRSSFWFFPMRSRSRRRDIISWLIRCLRRRAECLGAHCPFLERESARRFFRHGESILSTEEGVPKKPRRAKALSLSKDTFIFNSNFEKSFHEASRHPKVFPPSQRTSRN